MTNRSEQRSYNDLPWLSRLARRWHDDRTFAPAALPPAKEVAARKAAEGLRVSVAIPARDEEETLGDICRVISTRLMEHVRLVDELVVIEGGSSDDTASVARASGARVVAAADVLPEIPAVPGKGESLWRSLAVLSGDLIVWVDADIRNFDERFVTRLVAPLVADPSIAFVKAFYRRPLAHGAVVAPDEGGRVTELLARPLLAALYPELGGLRQPLAGEYAGRREALVRVPFFSGYSVEVGLLIDLLEEVGLNAIAQVDLTERVHRNRPLRELAPMAYAIARTILQRAEESGRLKAGLDYPTHPLLLPEGDDLVPNRVAEVERPPIALVPTYVSAMQSGSIAAAH